MSYNIIGKYIKDLDFKIPNPQMYSSLSKEIADNAREESINHTWEKRFEKLLFFLERIN